jgi:predicted esterase
LILKKFIEREVKELNNDYSKVFVGGWSGGGVITLHTAIIHIKQKLGGLFP